MKPRTRRDLPFNPAGSRPASRQSFTTAGVSVRAKALRRSGPKAIKTRPAGVCRPPRPYRSQAENVPLETRGIRGAENGNKRDPTRDRGDSAVLAARVRASPRSRCDYRRCCAPARGPRLTSSPWIQIVSDIGLRQHASPADRVDCRQSPASCCHPIRARRAPPWPAAPRGPRARRLNTDEAKLAPIGEGRASCHRETSRICTSPPGREKPARQTPEESITATAARAAAAFTGDVRPRRDRRRRHQGRSIRP